MKETGGWRSTNPGIRYLIAAWFLIFRAGRPPVGPVCELLVGLAPGLAGLREAFGRRAGRLLSTRCPAQQRVAHPACKYSRRGDGHVIQPGRIGVRQSRRRRESGGMAHGLLPSRRGSPSTTRRRPQAPSGPCSALAPPLAGARACAGGHPLGHAPHASLALLRRRPGRRGAHGDPV